MSVPIRIAAYAAGLALVFGGAVAAGAALDPGAAREEAPTGAAHGGGAATPGGAHADGDGTSGAPHAPAEAGGAPAGAHGGHAAGADAIRGLSVAQDGLRLVVPEPALRRGARERLAFRIETAAGTPVTRFDLEHERRLHLILVRRDLTGFQHLHPTMAPDGTWSTDVVLPTAGSWRLLADFSRGGEARTLATDLRVDGPARLRDLPAPAAVARSDAGDRVELVPAGGHAHADGGHGDAAAPPPVRAGEPATLTFGIARDGEPLELQPYLGASGHLVALREGDLAFLHVHPSGEGVAFETTFPSPGRYRLFLQYRAEGRVRTAAFTQEVTG